MNFDNNRLITIDTISVDEHSRLTLTRKLKKVLPILPKDTITVYQDRYNKDLIFEIQHDESNNTTDSLIIKTKSSTSIFYNKNTIEKKQTQEEQKDKISNQYIKGNSTLHDINIVIVDDSEDLVKTFQFFLRTEGYRNVQIFSDPKKVIMHFVQLKNADHYDLCLIDVRMPVINGIQLYQILTILNPDMKVLFVTGLDAVSELTSLHKIKKEDIIKKPCDSDQFIQIINDAVFKYLNLNK